MRSRLIPRDERRHEVVNRGVENTLAAARLLVDLLDQCEDIDRKPRGLCTG